MPATEQKPLDSVAFAMPVAMLHLFCQHIPFCVKSELAPIGDGFGFVHFLKWQGALENAFVEYYTQLEDTSRVETYSVAGINRRLSVLVYYPESSSIARGSCPLIVFSHGGMSFDSVLFDTKHQRGKP
ncbi:MAG TPA: hypothetical protein DEB31_02675 [Clostridiales bacterium]|nr:hypothetical protein [Clostridiales bacterium]